MIRAILPLAGLLTAAMFPPAVLAAPPPAGSAVLSAAPRCAATAEAAARSIVGDFGRSALVADASDGFRVQDLVLDPVLRKAYVRVADCRDPRKPLTLVALDTNLAATTTHAENSSSAGPQASSAVPVFTRAAAPTLIARGDAVEIDVRASNVQMTLHGRASEAASAGEALDVVLDSEPGSTESPRHLRGVAAAAHRVEVRR